MHQLMETFIVSGLYFSLMQCVDFVSSPITSNTITPTGDAKIELVKAAVRMITDNGETDLNILVRHTYLRFLHLPFTFR